MKFDFFTKKGQDIGIDLGTANIRIYTKNKGIIIDEPTVVGINNKTEQILAVGNEAKQMLGKTPPHIWVSRPLQHGIISDYEVAEKMLRYFIDKVHEGGLSFLSRPRVVVGVPLDVIEVEAKVVEDAIIVARAGEVCIVQ
ncbi:MAG: rod shape-determining protein, partial [Candidatus Magasanikbacteria bacterium]|nr:rod shape-determining protein [Candidatus Magasanikbacteria bacterium]